MKVHSHTITATEYPQ